MAARLIFLGAPGSGKGTQASRLAGRLSIPQISTGDMLREARANGTELGKRAAFYMDKGDLVPDDVVIGIIRERLQQDDCQHGFILDGFPRTLPQAQALDLMLTDMGLPLSHVIFIDVPDEEIIPRITGRRTCPNCGRSYHISFLPPKVPGRCDECGSDLVQRSDDTEDAVRIRLSKYREQTAPLVEFYENKGLLKRVHGVGDIEEIQKKILEIVA